MNQLSYSFKYVQHCIMCGAETDKHTILGKRLNKSQGRNPKKKIGITVTICKCSNCGLIYSNPQPVPASLDQHYGVPPENYWHEEYFKIDDSYFVGELEKVKTLMQFQPGMKALDIGAGLGKAMIAMERAGFDTYGFEASQPFYERALTMMKISKDKLKLGSIEKVEYPENFFDFISFGAVLEHLYDPSAAITKALHWCKPNGIIHIEVPSSDWLTNKLINSFYRIAASDYVGNISPMHPPYHLYEFSLNSFKQHALHNNYVITQHDYYVGETYMPRYLEWILNKYMTWTDKGMQLAVWIRKR